LAILTLDTCYLIDHQREVRAGRPGPAHEFASRHTDDVFAISTVAWGEFLAGFSSSGDEVPAGVRRHLRVLPMDESASEAYGRIFRELKNQGALLGANDLWIAAVALAAKLPLVSRNNAEFRRIPGLELLAY
jgi:tRNA(fMet)-specific endonuclease VapC